jgi:dipeptide/tripeptide permease
MGINIGSFIAPLISGWLIKSHGWHWGFGIGGIGIPPSRRASPFLYRVPTITEIQVLNNPEPRTINIRPIKNRSLPSHADRYVSGRAAGRLAGG